MNMIFVITTGWTTGSVVWAGALGALVAGMIARRALL